MPREVTEATRQKMQLFVWLQIGETAVIAAHTITASGKQSVAMNQLRVWMGRYCRQRRFALSTLADGKIGVKRLTDPGQDGREARAVTDALTLESKYLGRQEFTK